MTEHAERRGPTPNNTWGWGFSRLPTVREDYDSDDDGLIEVYNLDQLYAMRWDLDGDGYSGIDEYRDAFLGATEGMGCPASGCIGYELTSDLDMDTDGSGSFDAGDNYWNGGKGWEPIGDHPINPFGATFHGNGYTILNLYINRPSTDYFGLFGATDYDSVIRNVGLESVTVTGDQLVGAVAGEMLGDVINSHATGSQVKGTWWVGGLVGSNITGNITASYAMVDVTAHGGYVGGLAGANGESIVASYATGSVNAVGGIPEESRWLVTNGFGSLLGNNSGTVVASYAVGEVSGDPDGNYIGGLLGNNAGMVTDSYWDTESTDQPTSDGGTGKTTDQLQTPVDYVGIYEHWFVDTDGDSQTDELWHFAPSSEYPALKVDFNGDGQATWEEFGNQRPTAREPRDRRNVPQVFTTADNYNPLVGDTVTLTAFVEDDDDEEVTFNWQHLEVGEWHVVGPESETKTIRFDLAGERTYRAVATLDSGEQLTSEAVTIRWYLPTVSVTASDSTPLVGQWITLTAEVESGGAGTSSYQWERKFGDGTWREVGPTEKSKGVNFNTRRTAVYRAVITLTTGQTIPSEPITLTWRIGSRITVSNSAPARGEPVTWTAELMGGDCSSIDYAWYKIDADGVASSVEDSSSDTITGMFFYAVPRTNHVDVTCTDSVGNSITYTSDRVTVTATDGIWPYASITSDDDDNVVPVGTQVELATNLERRHPPLNWRATWERKFGNGEWRDVVPTSERKRVKFDSPGSRTYRASIFIIQLDETVKSEAITVTWVE